MSKMEDTTKETKNLGIDFTVAAGAVQHNAAEIR